MAKKLLVLCMAAIMAVAALVAGCGGDQKAASDNKVLKVGTNADLPLLSSRMRMARNIRALIWT